MTCENFKHSDPDEFHDKELTLHDCISNMISLEEKALRFYLPDGFWVTALHEENSSGMTVRTDASLVDFSIDDIDEIMVRVFNRNTWCWSRKMIAEIWHMGDLISEINSGKCTIEFITQYRAYSEQMWQCVIHSNKKPYYRECELYLPNTNATFYWNDLRLDRTW